MVCASVRSDRLKLVTRVKVVADSVRNGSAKDNQIQERIGAESVSTVHGYAGSLTASKQTRNDLVIASLVNGKNLTSVFCRNTAHVVVDSRQDGDGLLADVNTSEDTGSLRDTRQTLSENISGQVAQLEEDMVLVGTDAAALTNLHSHRSRNDVTRGQILGSWRISLHETLTLRVQEVATLTTGTFSDEATSAVDTGGVELDEFEILVGETGTGNHSRAITSAGMRGGAAEISTAITTSGQDGVVSEEAVQSTILLVVRQNTAALAVLHDQVEGEVLDEVVGVVAKRLSVQGMEERVSSSVGGSAASVGLSALTVLLRLATKGTLVATSEIAVSNASV